VERRKEEGSIVFSEGISKNLIRTLGDIGRDARKEEARDLN
jgi:hypothetical protein